MNDHISHEERADTGTGDSLAMTQLTIFFPLGLGRSAVRCGPERVSWFESGREVGL